jgi:hypothetical protein
MGMNLTKIRTELAAQIAANTQRAVHAYPYPPGTPGELPAVVIRSGETYINYFVTLGDEADVGLILDIMAPCRASLEDGLRVLDELLSSGVGLPASVFDAIEDDPTLGGLVERCEFGVAGQHVGVAGADGLPESVYVSVPLAVWVNRT